MTTPSYGFPIKSRSYPERMERARVDHKQACRKLMLAEQALERARRDAIESGRRLDALEDEEGEERTA